MIEPIKSKFSTILGVKRLRISDVSRNTGISRTTLTALYYGRGESISYKVLGKLCKYLNCNVGDILEADAEVIK